MAKSKALTGLAVKGLRMMSDTAKLHEKRSLVSQVLRALLPAMCPEVYVMPHVGYESCTIG